MYRYTLLLIALLLCLSSCNRAGGSSKDPDYQQVFYSDGKLHKEIMFRNGAKNGVSTEFYNNGQVFQKIIYLNNLRQGMAIRYYASGVLCQETPYDNDQEHGIQKRYRRSGELMAEVPYHEGNLCIGLKEYSPGGRLKGNYPTIVVTPIDKILKNGTYTLRLTVSDDSKGVEYFLGGLVKGKFIDESTQIPSFHGVAQIEYEVPRGMFKMEELNIIAKIKTSQSNYYITETKYHLAFESRL